MRLLHLFSAIILSALLLAGCKSANKDFSGQWAEKTAERIVADFTPDGDSYNVKIGWREKGLAQYEIWEMKAVPQGKGTLEYTGGTYRIESFEKEGDTVPKIETVYSDGTGKFSFNKDGDLVWTDDMDPGNPVVFMKAAFTEQ
ncbi:MAG: hypothetical protein IJL91_03630 [Bacteroidales bacterium]|nr:hypothetical protein [Bacteroidales bacterium]